MKCQGDLVSGDKCPIYEMEKKSRIRSLNVSDSQTTLFITLR